MSKKLFAAALGVIISAAPGKADPWLLSLNASIIREMDGAAILDQRKTKKLPFETPSVWAGGTAASTYITAGLAYFLADEVAVKRGERHAHKIKMLHGSFWAAAVIGGWTAGHYLFSRHDQNDSKRWVPVAESAVIAGVALTAINYQAPLKKWPKLAGIGALTGGLIGLVGVGTAEVVHALICGK